MIYYYTRFHQYCAIKTLDLFIIPLDVTIPVSEYWAKAALSRLLYGIFNERSEDGEMITDRVTAPQYDLC